jgi:hypothetical protein
LESGDPTDQVAQLVQGLVLDRCPAAAGSVKSSIVVSIDPRRRGGVDFTKIVPRVPGFNQLGLVQADRRFGERVVKGIADAGPIEASIPSVDEVLGEPERRVLATGVRMVHQLGRIAAGVDGFR